MAKYLTAREIKEQLKKKDMRIKNDELVDILIRRVEYLEDNFNFLKKVVIESNCSLCEKLRSEYNRGERQ